MANHPFFDRLEKTSAAEPNKVPRPSPIQLEELAFYRALIKSTVVSERQRAFLKRMRAEHQQLIANEAAAIEEEFFPRDKDKLVSPATLRRVLTTTFNDQKFFQ